MMEKKRSVGVLSFGILIFYLFFTGVLKAENLTNKYCVSEGTKCFNVNIPSDWTKEIDKDILKITGPVLNEKNDGPYIYIKEDKDIDLISAQEELKKNYNLWKSLPGFKNRIPQYLEKSFKEIYPQDEFKFISSDFEDERDFIITHTISINKKKNLRFYSVDFITKAKPTRSYNLLFICNDEYFSQYLPVFKKCLENFNVTN